MKAERCAPVRRRRRRSDGERNAVRVREAADAVFAERGLSATVEQIADRAGVGRATVYRSFPSRAELVEAMMSQRIGWLRERLQQAMVAQDFAAEFGSFVHDLILRVLDDRVLGEVVPPSAFRDVPPGADIQDALEEFVARGRAEGVIAADIGAPDLGLLIYGAVLALFDKGERDPARWHRAAELVVRATTGPRRDVASRA